MTDARKSIKHLPRALAHSVLLFGALGGLLLSGIARATEHVVATPLVTVDVEDQPLGSVLDSIREATGFEVRLTDDRWRALPVTVRIDGEPKDKALRTLFRDFNYVITEQSDTGMTLNISSGAAPPTENARPTDGQPKTSAPASYQDSSLSEGLEVIVPPDDLVEMRDKQPGKSTKPDYEADLLLLQEMAQRMNELEGLE